MRSAAVGLVCLYGILYAQSARIPSLPSDGPDAQRVRELVDAGALPRLTLQQVEEAEADARDREVLDLTLYGKVGVEDLSEEQAEQMLKAARRQLDRRAEKLRRTKELAAEGVIPRTAVGPVLEEYNRGLKTLDLAESRANLFRELVAMVHAEQAAEAAVESPLNDAARIAERYDGAGRFNSADLKAIVLAFEKRFAQPLPISANGSTALHRSLGFDHRGRVDVALHPDQEEGRWLRETLESLKIPYFAFWQPVPGKATGAHIHIGPPSLRLRNAD